MASPFNFLKKMESDETTVPMLNFSPLFDVLSGYYIEGHDNVYYLNGGLTPNNAVTGGNNTQKTGVCVLALARTIVRYTSSVALFFDLEATFDVGRLAKLVDREAGIDGYFNDKILNQRFFYYTRNQGLDGTAMHNLIKEYYQSVKEAIKNKEDVYMSTVFKDKNGKPLNILNCTLLVCDSISEMPFTKTSIHFQEGDVDSGGEKRTRDMQIGNLRRIVYEDADNLGGEVGFYQIWTAQVVDIINMTGRPLEKESVFIRQGKKLKAPKALLQRPPLGIEIFRGSALKNGNEWMYPDPFGKDVVIDKDAKEMPDLIQYTSGTYRNKSGPSGLIVSFIGSQALGIQEELSMYDTLKKNDYFGLDGSKVSHACTFYPDVKLGRTTIRAKIADDKKLRTALTLQYHLLINNKMNLTMDNKYRLSPQEVYEKIKARGYDWDDMLNTVYFWHDNKDIKEPTLCVMELLKIALGEKKPHWHKK